MKLLITGDLTLQGRTAAYKWDYAMLEDSFAVVKDVADGCDHAIVNLESPVTDCDLGIIKDGPVLKQSEDVFVIIKYCGFDVVTLSNNHLKDYGQKGVLDTLNAVKKHGVNYVGAGRTLQEARVPLVFNDVAGGEAIGIVNVCEHESSIATGDGAGANPLDMTNLYYDIKDLRCRVDRVVVIIHGGKEHYRLPTPRMKRDYHLLIDFGADVIVNHHQHCYSGYEIYNGKPIFYGLGNFYFDRPKKEADKWNYGLMLQLELKLDSYTFDLIPYQQCNGDTKIIRISKDEVKYQLENLNAIIADDRLLEDEMEKLVVQSKLLFPFIPFGNKTLRSLYYRGLMPRFLSRQNMALIENAISCESHRELLLKYLNNNIHNE